MPLSSVALIAFAVFSAVTSQLIFKSWVNGLGVLPVTATSGLGIISRIIQSPLMIAGLILYGLGFLTWIMLLSRSSLSLVYPIVISANVIFVLIFSGILFHETIGMMQIVGTIVVLLGIFLVFTS